jgi:3-methyladenine DNA glycosylase AlkD
MSLITLQKTLKQSANRQKAKFLQRYFKTGKGEYGEGDIFLGITVPELRKIAARFTDLPFSDLAKLLKSKVHEHRFIALEILVMKFEKSRAKSSARDLSKQKAIIDFYLNHTAGINNWDLVDTSSWPILGAWLFDQKRDNSHAGNKSLRNAKNRAILYKLVRSKNIWERRMAIVSTYFFITKNEFGDTLKIATILLNDAHDLIHKAVGWMLREVSKRDKAILKKFLKTHAAAMPRTMLRYAIEKFPPAARKRYLSAV